MGCGSSNQGAIKEPLVIRNQEDIKTVSSIKISNLTFFDETQKKITDIYEIGQLIHFDKFGVVKKVVKKDSKEERVVKIVNKKFIDEDRSQYLIVNEIQTLTKLNHPNIVKVFEYFRDDINYYFIYEFVNAGSLMEQVIETNTFTEKVVRIVIKQILECLSYLHLNKYAHRDLSLRNILVNTFEDLGAIQIKMIDWNHSSSFQNIFPMFRTPVGDLLYRSPEMFTEQYDYLCDIWSAGELPFQGKNDKETQEAIQNQVIKFDSPNWQNVSKECQIIIKLMLQKDPKKRPTASELLKNEWFTKQQSSDNDVVIQKSKHIDSMFKFQAYNILQKAALTYIATQEISQTEKGQISQLFSKLDTENNGTLSIKEIQNVSKIKFGAMKSESEAAEILEKLDSNKNGKVDYNEFVTSVYSRQKLESEENIQKAFKYFDKDQNGFITISELKQSLGYSFSQKNEKQWQELMQKQDMDGDNKISFQEFKVIVQSFSSK